RSSARRQAAAEGLQEPQAVRQPDEAVARKRAWMQLDEFLAGLDQEQREVFVLAELVGMRVPEVAAVVDAPLNTLYSRLRIARRRFNDRFGVEHAEMLRRAGEGECPTKKQRRHVWMLVATELFPAAVPVTVVATTSLAVKWAVAGGVAAVIAVTSTVALRARDAPTVETIAAPSSVSDSVDTEPYKAGQGAVVPPRPESHGASNAAASRLEPPIVVAATVVEASSRTRSAKASVSARVPTDSLSTTVAVLREAQRLVQAGRASAALAAIDGLGHDAAAPMRVELHRIEREAACLVNDTTRAGRAHDALVALGSVGASASACEEK
ncbi:MAG: hypothetical protein JKY37_27225, partial [Nannocystaceae bacterium]|nr:hypothetical protein [Nannocystaceae bacterium]